MTYFVYMLLCEDGSYYTGITDDLERRWQVHLSGKGAKYTRSHRPVKIVYSEKAMDKSAALIREYELKSLNHAAKARLAARE